MLNLSFAGCGFLGLYHLGVVSCIKTYAPQVFNKKVVTHHYVNLYVGNKSVCYMLYV